MAPEVFEEISADPRLLYRHSVEQYHRMIAAGLVEEGAPYELLDGQVIRKLRNRQGEDSMTVGDEHVYVVMKLTEIGRRLSSHGCHLRAQQPVALPPFDEPEPDAAIVRGTIKDYRDHKPGPAEILCVIEVADASLRRDRTTKQRIYADAGIEEFLIVNLPDRVIEVYTEPHKGKGRYGQLATLTGKQKFSLPTGTTKRVVVSVSQILS
jgi:Uma2 family endonuclease